MANITKTPCPITREHFHQHAAPNLDVTVGGAPIPAARREFSTGTLGWYVTRRVVLEIGGVKVSCQAQITVTLPNSKELPS